MHREPGVFWLVSPSSHWAHTYGTILADDIYSPMIYLIVPEGRLPLPAGCWQGLIYYLPAPVYAALVGASLEVSR